MFPFLFSGWKNHSKRTKTSEGDQVSHPSAQNSGYVMSSDCYDHLYSTLLIYTNSVVWCKMFGYIYFKYLQSTTHGSVVHVDIFDSVALVCAKDCPIFLHLLYDVHYRYLESDTGLVVCWWVIVALSLQWSSSYPPPPAISTSNLVSASCSWSEICLRLIFWSNLADPQWPSETLCHHIAWYGK